jgi:D-amino-acid dehydrogenase
MTPRPRVAVIGGGVIGLACAHFLRREGFEVSILERGRIGGGSTAGNCGLICPSHVLPLAEPGMIRKTLVAMLRPRSPLSIKLRPDPALGWWLLHFAARCNRRDLMAAAAAIQPLLDRSLEIYRELVEREGLECEWEPRGLLFVYRSPRAMADYEPTDRLLTDAFGLPSLRFDGAGVVEFEPALKPGLAGGYYYAEDAHLRPESLLASWKKALVGEGVEIREQCSFQGFRMTSGRALAAETDQGDVAADAFVIATGAWTPLWSSLLGCSIPIQPGKGYSITMPRPPICPAVPLIFPETRVAVTPFRSGYRLGSTMEFAGYDESIDPRRLQLLRDGAAPYLQLPVWEPIEQTWFGWRPMTWDSLPIIDRSPAIDNVYLAAGHNMLGLSMAPATGKLIAQLVAGKPPFLEVAPYRVTRFSGTGERSDASQSGRTTQGSRGKR